MKDIASILRHQARDGNVFDFSNDTVVVTRSLLMDGAAEIERLRAALDPETLRYAIEHAGFGAVSDGEINEIMRKLGCNLSNPVI